MRQLRHLHMHTSLTHASDSATSLAHAPTLPSRFAHATFGVSGWGRDDMRPAWYSGTPQQGHFHMHTPLFGDFRVSGWGFGVGFRGFGVGS